MSLLGDGCSCDKERSYHEDHVEFEETAGKRCVRVGFVRDQSRAVQRS
jgi:hypothetical protein